MTEPLDLGDIIDAKPEWTDAELITRLRKVIGGQGLSMQAMAKELKQRDTEIAQWRADCADTATCLNNERKKFHELLNERDAEIVELQQERDQAVHSLDARHTRYVELEAEIARLRAPPGADVMERAQAVFNAFDWRNIEDGICKPEIDKIARALQQYGDGRAREWRHKKRDSTYVERDRGELQLSTDHVLKEGDRLVSYRGTDGRTWFRYEPEFEDGRFERIT